MGHNMCKYAQVVIEFATAKQIDRFFTYKIDDALKDKVVVGCRVKVPFGKGNKYQIGYVVHLLEAVLDEGYKIKSILDTVDEGPILSEEQLDVARFITEYYGSSFAASIGAILPPGLTEKPLKYEKSFSDYIETNQDRESIGHYIFQNSHKKTFAKQKQILECILLNGKATLDELSDCIGSCSSSVNTLIKNGLLKKQRYYDEIIADTISHEKFKQLNEEQQIAYDQMLAYIKNDEYQTILLQGVTGSGKTEIFLYTIKDVLEKGGAAIVLVPEIALTRQTVNRFKERFGNAVALTHSRMTPKERQNLYMKARAGDISIIIGPRSAVFAPLKNLKLIVVDEEHETTYKSETTPKYNAVQVAKMRMQRTGGIVILASATPSLETYYEATKGEIKLATLKNRVGNAVLPSIEVVDMRIELQQGNNSPISRVLYVAIKTTLEQGNQVMLLLNRRGHSTFINCRNCGFVVKCKHCDIAMTYHMRSKSLECHYCGSKQVIPEICPSCGSKHIRFFGNGTEKIEEYLTNHFLDYGVGRMDFETTSGKDGHSKILEAFNNREINVLVGTQMISKGHDFPNVTLVGILAADMSLYMEDFRSDERTFQLLTQTLGRAGRGDKRGNVVIQTYNPEHRVIERVKYFESEQFYEEELASRQLMGYPPFSHLFSLLISGRDEQEVIQKAHMLSAYYQYYNKKKMFKIIGPVPAVISKVADEYRWKIIIMGEEREKVLIYGKFCLEKFIKRELTDRIRISWDIDPRTMI